jgi:hypothetical protein
MAPVLAVDMGRVVVMVEGMEAAVVVVVAVAAAAAKVEALAMDPAPALDMATAPAPVVASEMDATELTSMARRTTGYSI